MEDIKAAGGSENQESLDKVSLELEKLHCQLVELRLEQVRLLSKLVCAHARQLDQIITSLYSQFSNNDEMKIHICLIFDMMML